MKIWHISDTHGMHNNFPEEPDVDLIIHSGDCSNWKDPIRNTNEVRDFIAWYSSLRCPNKIYVAGNHDTSVEKRYITPADFTQAGITYLENESTYVGDFKVFGSPFTPTFGDWAFMKARHKISKVWDLIPEDTDILIVHGPPISIRDLSYNYNNTLEFCGDRALLRYVEKIQPKLMCFGHIHNCKDILNQGTSYYGGMKTLFSNAACVEDGRFEKGLTSFGNIINL